MNIFQFALTIPGLTNTNVKPVPYDVSTVFNPDGSLRVPFACIIERLAENRRSSEYGDGEGRDFLDFLLDVNLLALSPDGVNASDGTPIKTVWDAFQNDAPKQVDVDVTTNQAIRLERVVAVPPTFDTKTRSVIASVRFRAVIMRDG